MNLISQQFIRTLNLNLRDKIPFLILVNFILLLILIYFNRKELKLFFKNIKTKTWTILLLILLLSLGLRMFTAPHIIRNFGDEAWYMWTAKKLLETNFLSQVNYAKAIGWPFILALSFRVFGISNWTALYTSFVLGALTVLNIFFLSILLFKKESIALWSSFLFCLMPLHIVWSGSSETNVPSLFFVTLSLFLSFLYFKRKTLSLLFLSLISLAFASQFRQENYLYFLLFFAGLIIFYKISLKKITPFKLNHDKIQRILVWIFLILLLVLLTGPNLIQVLNFQLSTNWAQRESGGELLGQNWSFSNLVYNFPRWGMHIFTNKYHPFIFSALFIAGIIHLFKRKRGELLFLLIWFFSLFLVYFSSWPTLLALESRFLISFYPITSIFAGVSLYLVYKKISENFNPKKLAIIFVLILLLVFSPAIKKQIGDNPFKIQGKLETKIPGMAEKEIPPNCIIISNIPEMISATSNLQAIKLDSFLDSKFEKTLYNLDTPLDIKLETKEDGIISIVDPYNTDCILFLEDYSCEMMVPPFPKPIKNCELVKQKYRLVPFLSYSEKEIFTQLKTFIHWSPSLCVTEIVGVDKNNNSYLIDQHYQFNKTTREIIEKARNIKEKYNNIEIFLTNPENSELIKQALEEGLIIKLTEPKRKTFSLSSVLHPLLRILHLVKGDSKKPAIEITKSYTFYRLYSKNTPCQ